MAELLTILPFNAANIGADPVAFSPSTDCKKNEGCPAPPYCEARNRCSTRPIIEGPPYASGLNLSGMEYPEDLRDTDAFAKPSENCRNKSGTCDMNPTCDEEGVCLAPRPFKTSDLGSLPVALVCKRPDASCSNPPACGTSGCIFG